MRQPCSVRTARVFGPREVLARGSLMAAAMTARSRTIVSSDAANAATRRSLPAARAISQRRTSARTATRCMLTPMATDASPRASRPEATIRSWTELTPKPPSSTGTGAMK